MKDVSYAVRASVAADPSTPASVLALHQHATRFEDRHACGKDGLVSRFEQDVEVTFLPADVKVSGCVDHELEQGFPLPECARHNAIANSN